MPLLVIFILMAAPLIGALITITLILIQLEKTKARVWDEGWKAGEQDMIRVVKFLENGTDSGPRTENPYGKKERK